MDNDRMPEEMRAVRNGPPSPVYRIVLVCEGMPTTAGPKAAVDITEEFTRRPWHRNAACTWDGHALLLQVENDFDPGGLATMDEFSDAISACVAEGFKGGIRMRSAIVL